MRRSPRARFHEEQELAAEGINVSPLIDVVFILLIFFIVTTVFVRETGIDVERPRAATSGELSEEAILLAVDAQGLIYFGGNQIEPRLLRNLLEQMIQKKDRPVIIQADRKTSTEDLVRVMDQAGLAGATRINLATLKEGS